MRRTLLLLALATCLLLGAVTVQAQALFAKGGDGRLPSFGQPITLPGSPGVTALGGSGFSGAGAGVDATGGSSNSGAAGAGINARGGFAIDPGQPAPGVFAQGGDAVDGHGGSAVNEEALE